MNTRKQKLLLNTAIFAISNFASKVLVFLMLPIYTSILTTSEYGTADLIIAIGTLSLPFLTMCIGDAGLRFAIENENDKKRVFTQGLLIVFIGTVLLFLLYPAFAHISFIGGENLIYVYLITVPYFFSDYFLKYARGVGKIREVGLSGVLSTFVMILTNIICLVVLKLGLYGYLLSFCATYTVNVIYMLIFAKLYKYFSVDTIRHFDMELMKKMLKYSLPLMPNQTCWWINDTANKFIINSKLGPDSVGLYSAAYKIPATVTTVQNFFSDAWLLSAIEEGKSEDKLDFYIKYYDFYCSLLVIMCSGMMVITKPLAQFLFSDSFIEAGLYVPGLLLSSMLGGMVGFIGAFFNAYNKTKYLFTSTITGAACSIVLNYLLTSVIGVLGAVVSNVLSYTIIWLMRFFEARRVLKIKLHYKKIFASYIILLTQIFLSFLLNDYYIWLTVSNITFLLLCFLVWKSEVTLLTSGTIELIKKKINQIGRGSKAGL